MMRDESVFSLLKVGDTVCWQGNASDKGEVIDKGYAALVIKWADGQTGTYTPDRLREFGVQRVVAKKTEGHTKGEVLR